MHLEQNRDNIKNENNKHSDYKLSKLFWITS